MNLMETKFKETPQTQTSAALKFEKLKARQAHVNSQTLKPPIYIHEASKQARKNPKNEAIS